MAALESIIVCLIFIDLLFLVSLNLLQWSWVWHALLVEKEVDFFLFFRFFLSATAVFVLKIQLVVCRGIRFPFGPKK